MSDHSRICIGNQTAISAATVMQPFDYALENGFEAFEWFPDKKAWGAGWDESDLDHGAREYIRNQARARNIRLSVHARWQANPLNPESYPVLLKDLDLARDLGAALLNIHLYAEQGLDAYARAIVPLVKVVAQMGLQLAIENTPLTGPQDFNQLFAALRSLDSLPLGHVGMCLDVGHANLYGWTRHDYLKYMDQLDPAVPINHLHFHENYGDYDSHLALFTGPAGSDRAGVVGAMRRLKQRNYSGSLILEQWPHPVWLLRQARDKLIDCGF
jgi:sugar phosphate isomerase/epimerase